MSKREDNVEILESDLRAICEDSISILDECFKDLESNGRIILKARDITRRAHDTILKNIEKEQGKRAEIIKSLEEKEKTD